MASANYVKSAANILVTAGVGALTGAGWRIFGGHQPAEPDKAITIYFVGGRNPSPLWLLDYPSLSVRVRGTPFAWEATQVKAEEVKDALLGLPSQDIDGDRWVSVTMLGDMRDLGHDDKDRPVLGLDFQTIIQPASGTNRIPLAV
ncbi:hypothetical protein LCGC14_1314940 [marine sediment metagenome]|uniref:Uncharacterized protein n=1 Tax=marine sediment metagenome TaxID=412755 RepID=A0A0F9N244_9ZZZZ